MLAINQGLVELGDQLIAVINLHNNVVVGAKD